MTLVDTNIWFAYFDKSDYFHQKAVEIIENSEKLALPYSVLLEVVTLLSYRISKEVAEDFLMMAVNIKQISVIDNETDGELFYFLHHKTKMSFTDYSLAYLSNQYGFDLVTFDKQLERFVRNNKAKVIVLE